MKIVPISSIAVAERQRKEFDPESLHELCEDIAYNGLQHPPVVRSTQEGLLLVSGERRLRVISELASAGLPIRYGSVTIPLDHIPVTDFGELTNRDAQIMELSENIKRKDLTWQERAAAEALLHGIRVEEKAESGAKQTYLATAEEIAGHTLGETERAYASTSIRTSVVLAQHLGDPDVAKAATPREALKVVQKKETVAHYQKLATFLGSTQQADRHTLIKGDALLTLPTLPNESFDCILTDPPYGINAQDFGTQISNEHRFDDTEETWTELAAALAIEGYRVCKQKAHAYVFCDVERFLTLRDIFASIGWRCFRTPLVWNKGTGVLPLPDHGPRRCYETILFAIKGDRPTTAVYGDVITIGPEKTTIHPDQKPADLYVDLLRRSVRPGELVLDPFAGSGTIFAAANRLQLTATGIEKEDVSYALSSQRLQEKVI